MKRNKLLEVLGYHFVLNRTTNEVHDLNKLHKNCQFKLMRNCRYISGRQARKIINKEPRDACRWCMS